MKKAPVATTHASIPETTQKAKESSILMLKKPENSMKATKGLKKKDKIKLKRKALEQKLMEAQAVRTELKAKKKRDKVPIIGDTKPMSDTLKMLDALLEEDDRKKAKQSTKKKPAQKKIKAKEKNAQFTKDLHLFTQVKKHKEFLKDPFNTIGTHIENKALADAAMDDV